eukprot:XP_001699855.1 predicted protein [Chlamydomonas reinhardtii]
MLSRTCLPTKPTTAPIASLCNGRISTARQLAPTVGVAALGFGRRREQLRTTCALSKGKSDANSSTATTGRLRKSGAKDATPPNATSPDDIALVPHAYLYQEQLERVDVASVSDMRRLYQRERGNFRRYLLVSERRVVSAAASPAMVASEGWRRRQCRSPQRLCSANASHGVGVCRRFKVTSRRP